MIPELVAKFMKWEVVRVVIVVTPELQIGSTVQNVMIGCTAFVLNCHAIKQKIKILFLFVTYVKVINNNNT